MAVLVSHLIIPSLKHNVAIPEFLKLMVELSLLLLHSLMVHFIEIFLFQQLFIRAFCPLRHYDGLIQLFPELPNSPLELLVFLVLKGHLLDPLNYYSLLQGLIPLLLEVI